MHFEPWFARGEAPPAASWGKLDRDEALAGVAEALGALATFVGAERVTVGRVLPSRFTLALRRGLGPAPGSLREDGREQKALVRGAGETS